MSLAWAEAEGQLLKAAANAAAARTAARLIVSLLGAVLAPVRPTSWQRIDRERAQVDCGESHNLNRLDRKTILRPRRDRAVTPWRGKFPGNIPRLILRSAEHTLSLALRRPGGFCRAEIFQFGTPGSMDRDGRHRGVQRHRRGGRRAGDFCGLAVRRHARR